MKGINENSSFQHSSYNSVPNVKNRNKGTIKHNIPVDKIDVTSNQRQETRLVLYKLLLESQYSKSCKETISDFFTKQKK